MNRYIITEEDICTIRDYVLGAFYEGENKEKIYDLLESQFSVMRSHPYQSERDCPVCGGGLMCHRWCIDRDCGWDSIPVGRLTMTPPQCPGFILAETTDGLVLSYRGEEFTVDDDMRKDLIAYLEIQSRRDKVLDRLDKEIHIREDEMNRKAGLEENLVTMSGYYASAGALNWVRKVLIDGSRETIRQAGSP